VILPCKAGKTDFARYVEATAADRRAKDPTIEE
jgi:hypothetical protein